MSIILRAIILGALALSIAACDGAAGGLCVRDPVAIAERRSCRADEDCPCGAGCELGRCEAACTSDSECEAGWCDDFGRCRAADDRSPTPPVHAVAAARIHVSTPLVRLSDPAVARSFEIDFEQIPEGRARVEAAPGLEVRCGESGEYGVECVLDGMSGGARLVVWARATEALPAGTARDVLVFAGEEVATVGVTSDAIDGRPAPAPDPELVSGVYEGSARLVALGAGGDPARDGSPAPLTLVVRARVWTGAAGGTIVELEDPRRTLHPEGRWAGRVADAAGAPTLDLPTASYLRGDAWTGAPIEILADALPVPLALLGESFALELPVRFLGVVEPARAPFTRWAITLSRVADLPDGAPPAAVFADATSTLDVARAEMPTPWEAAALVAIGDENLGAASEARLREVLSSFSRISTEGTASLAACTLERADLDLLGRVALDDAWGAGTSTGGVLSPSLTARLEGAFLSSGATADLTARLTSSVRSRVLPCDVTFAIADTGSTCVAGSRYRLGRVNACDAVAQAYGCEIADAPVGATLDVAVSGTVTAGACTETLAEASAAGTVARVCRLPPLPEGCAEMALCYAPPPAGTGDLDRASLASSRFGETMLASSGDLACASGGGLFALDAMLELTPCPPESPACERLGAASVLEVCAAELDAVRAASPPASPGVFAAGLRRLFAARPECVDPARYLLALGLATEADRRRASERETARTELASRVAHRLVQRLASQLAFHAREASERELLGEMFRHTAAGATLPPAEDTIAEVEPIWELLLHPRFAIALDRMPGSVLVDPDYRPLALGHDVATEPHHEQTTGLPVTLIDTLSAELALLEPRLEWAALDHDETALELLSRALRLALVTRPIARSMVARAEEASPAVPLLWGERFASAESELDARISRLGAQADAIVAGRNPLGIEDSDLPLYFFGDESTPATRFSAVSDFLIGQMPGSVISGSAWAPALVQIARDAWDDAMPLYVEQLDRQVQVRQAEAGLEADLEAIRVDFGYRLADLCYPDHLATRDLLERWDFDENTCFFRSTAPECQVDLGEYPSVLTPARLRYQMCLIAEARRSVSTSISLGDPELDALADSYDGCRSPRYPVDCPAGEGTTGPCIQCDVGGTTYVAPLTPDHFRGALAAAYLPARVTQDIENTCLERHPDADPTLPSIADLPSSPLRSRECYNGALGEGVFEVLAAQQEVEIARAEFEAARARYDIAMETCAIQHAGADRIEALMRQHDETMRGLEGVKLGLDAAANVSDAAADCLATLANKDLLSEFIGATGVAVASCGARLASAGLRSGITATENQMDQAERSHDLAAQMVEADTEHAACLNDAEMELVDQRAALLRIDQAAIELEAAHYRLQEMAIAARTVYDDGRALLAATRGRFVPPLTHDLWLDAQVSRFWRDMRLARRVTYLAVRAVEYELQQSSPLRDRVLRARLPDELWGVLTELWTLTGVRTIRGNRPTDLKVVVSLREHLLQLADRSSFADTEHDLTDVERFRLFLTAPEHAVHDESGRYLGQRIPFTLAPLGVVELGDSHAIPVLAGSDCAERLWSVNASILGTGVFRGGTPTFARLDLLKSNTFYSQWCDGTEGVQVASVRPSRNLFRDPVYGVGAGAGDPLGLANEATDESRARIEAYFNVPREEFERDEYANGSTSELAARGLYGEYAIFIPAEALSIDGSSGVALENVDDILLRLDYVSVAR